MSFKYLLSLLFVGTLLVSCNPSEAETASTPPASTSAAGEGAVNEGAAGEGAAPSAARSVRTFTARQGPLSATRSTSATIEPLRESQVAAGTGGRVERVLKREGTLAEAGETVIILDARNLELQVQNAQLALDSARINLQKAERSSRENTPQLSLQRRTAQTNFDLAQRQYDEGQRLFDAGGISSTELSGLEAQLSQAEAALTQATDAVARSERAGTEDLALLRVQLSQAETQLAQAEDALAEARITAPFAGEVADVLVEEGEFVAAGSPAFRLVSTERQLGRFSLPPGDAQQLLGGGDVFFRYGGLDYGAAIVRSSAASTSQRLTQLTAEIYPSDTPIPAGSVAQLTYTVPLGSGVQIPTTALGVRQGQNYVLTLEDGVTKQREVNVVAEVSGQAIVEGLEDGAEVVAPLPADLRDGTQVQVVER